MKLKKLIVSMLIIVLVFGTVACKKSDGNDLPSNGQDQGKKELEASLEDIMKSLYKDTEVKADMLQNTVLTDENSQNFIGLEKLDGAEGLASEMLINVAAHSVVLLRVKDGTDIEAIKAEIKEKVDPRKWICVGVEEENIIVDNIGNTILLIMDNNISKVIHQNFLALAK